MYNPNQIHFPLRVRKTYQMNIIQEIITPKTLMVSGHYQDFTTTLNYSRSQNFKSNVPLYHTPLTHSVSVLEAHQEIRSMSLPLFSPLLVSLLPCVKLHSTCQFNHAYSQTFSSLAPIFLSHLSYQSYFLTDISYMDVLGIQIQNTVPNRTYQLSPRACCFFYI